LLIVSIILLITACSKNEKIKNCLKGILPLKELSTNRAMGPIEPSNLLNPLDPSNQSLSRHSHNIQDFTFQQSDSLNQHQPSYFQSSNDLTTQQSSIQVLNESPSAPPNDPLYSTQPTISYLSSNTLNQQQLAYFPNQPLKDVKTHLRSHLIVDVGSLENKVVDQKNLKSFENNRRCKRKTWICSDSD